MAEQSARVRNADKLQEVLDRIIDLALVGNEAAMKLVWNSMMSTSSADQTSAAAEKVSININTSPVGAEKEVPRAEIVYPPVKDALTAESAESKPSIRDVIGEVIHVASVQTKETI